MIAALMPQVLLINFPSLGSNEAGDVIRFIFRRASHHGADTLPSCPKVSRDVDASTLSFLTVRREAKIHDCLLFFDECESIFEDR